MSTPGETPAESVKKQPRAAAVDARSTIKSQAEQLATTGEGTAGQGVPSGDVNVRADMTSREDTELDEGQMEKEEEEES